MKNAKQLREIDSIGLLKDALVLLEKGFPGLEWTKKPAGSPEAIRKVLAEVAERLQDNYPYFHPTYAGQMLKPPHLIARVAYSLAMWINPNNHALDGGKASSQMEKEAVADIAAMFGWKKHLGHLTSGGTMANLEALWVSGMLRPGETVAASKQAHYTHSRISHVLGLPFETIPNDDHGRMDINALRKRLRNRTIGTVVATIGTTATGSVDPLPQILELREKYGFRLHADAAYGGYFGLSSRITKEARQTFDRLGKVDSIVIDPHKHGLQPYGCGCVLFRDPAVGTLYKHDSPYTYFSSTELHLGEISLECSRPGAAAVGLWATQRLFPLVKNGVFARGLDHSREAALKLYEKIRKDKRFVCGFPPELDIVFWAPRAGTVNETSILARQIFEECARQKLHLALAELPIEFLDITPGGLLPEGSVVTCLRSVLMKREHNAWIGRLWKTLDRATSTVLKRQ